MKKNVFLFGAKISKKIVLIALSFLITVSLIAQNGSITGKVLDAQNSEPLIGAAVTISGTTTGGATDFDGNYTIPNLKPGTYSLTISYISYKTQTKANVVVVADKPTVADILLESADISLNEVTVVARANRESENILLLEQKQALLATQAVGAKEMSRKGISDAESAVAKVSGISKQEGVKNVFVRGLGDRYNVTYLNGFPIPSEDPEYKNIALDFFGTDVIQSIGVNKVFNSSLAGDVGGAIIDIASKELVGQRSLSLEATAGANFSAIQNPYFVQDGYSYLGFADRTRPESGSFGFKNSMDPYQIFPLNHSFGVSGGKSYKVGDNSNPLSFYIVTSQSKSYSAVLNEIVRNITPDGLLWHDQTSKKYSNNTNQLALANVQYGFNSHRLVYNFMLVHANNQYVGEYEGKNSERHQDSRDDSYWGYLRRQQTNDNLLIVNQLSSEWTLSEKWKLNAGVSYNAVTGSEPDRRENYLTRNLDGTFGLTGSDRQKRFYSILNEKDANAKLNLIYKLNDNIGKGNSNIQFGYTGRYIDDNFNALEYVFSAVDGTFPIDNLKLDEAYNAANLKDGKFSMRRGFNNKYSVTKFINSPYAEITYQFTPALTVNAGLKGDIVMMYVDYTIETNAGTVPFNKFYPLPSLNLKYDLTSEHSLRLGLSKTYTLPQSKEISPYEYVNISFVSKGDKDIKPSENYNADLKWDYYMSPSELISITGFYKHILRPIGRVDASNSAGQLIYKNIAKFASVAGAELEIRKNIINSNSNERTNRLSTGLSASYIYSNLLLDIINTAPRNVQLEGAAPFIVNFDISYNYTYKELNLVNSLVFNYFSARIHTIGAQSFKQNLMEEGVPTLDFVSSSKISKNLTLKLKASNLLNPSYRLTRKNNAGTQEFILSEYKKGTSVSIGLAYDL